MLVSGFFSRAAMSVVDNIRIRQALIDDLREVQTIARSTYIEHFAHAWSEMGLQSFLQREFSEEALRASLSSPFACSALLPQHDTLPARITQPPRPPRAMTSAPCRLGASRGDSACSNGSLAFCAWIPKPQQ